MIEFPLEEEANTKVVMNKSVFAHLISTAIDLGVRMAAPGTDPANKGVDFELNYEEETLTMYAEHYMLNPVESRSWPITIKEIPDD